jgi:hypothetical protein
MIRIVSKFYIRSNLFRTASLLFHFGRLPWARSLSLSSWLPSVLVVAPSASHDPSGLEVEPPLWHLLLSRFPLRRHHFPPEVEAGSLLSMPPSSILFSPPLCTPRALRPATPVEVAASVSVALFSFLLVLLSVARMQTMCTMIWK